MNDDLSEEDFELVIDNSTGSFHDMICDIYEQWQDGRELSERQIEVVQNAVSRLESRRRR